MKLEGKIALVTGAGSGIGRATALLFAEHGADIAVNDIDLPAALKTVEEIHRFGRRAIAVQADVADEQAVDAMVDKIVAEFSAVDILINNAGIPVHGGLIEAQTAENWDRVIAVILRGTYLCCRRVGKWMVDHRRGRIVNISSVAGLRGSPGMAGYGAAKSGIINLTRSLAGEWGKYGINVNCLTPGLIDTPLTQRTIARWPNADAIVQRIPLGRMGKAVEVAKAALFLSSDDASYISGVTLPVDGGQLTGV